MSAAPEKDPSDVLAGLVGHNHWAGWAIAFLAILGALGTLLKGISWLSPVFRFALEQFAHFYGREKRRAIARRRSFLDSLEGRLSRLNLDESWADKRYAELEAEVEAEGERGGRGLRMLFTSQGGRRRESNLTSAMMSSKRRLILLQGDPGSGKSVALRHLASNLTVVAKKSRRSHVAIPLYINLKELRPVGEALSAEDIREYLFTSLSAALDDRRQIEYLTANFDSGLLDGTWLFLFDSFDEIPEILSAVEIDETVKKYSTAISHFMDAVSPCRGLLASREYRGPGSKDLQWPRFWIVPLSERRKRQFIRRAAMDMVSERLMLAELPNAVSSLRQLSDNPLVLGLMCEYVESERQFPRNSHLIFESHVARSFGTDHQAILSKFSLLPSEIREVAEIVAYCMAAEPNLGLSANEESLVGAIAAQGFDVNRDTLVLAMSALRYVRLARAEEKLTPLELPTLTYAHRRFQEYFATCLVLDRPELVSDDDLLLNGRWRETAVTVLQMQPPDRTRGLLLRASAILETCSQTTLAHRDVKADEATEISETFDWPAHSLHLMSLLDAGLTGRVDLDDSDVKDKSGELLLAAATDGLIVDRKWAIESVGAAKTDVMIELLRIASRSGSGWLREAAFRQIGRLRPIPEDLAAEIRMGLLTYAVGGRLRRDSLAVDAQLRRLDSPGPLINAKRLLLAAPFIDTISHVLILGLVISAGIKVPDFKVVVGMIFVSAPFFYLLRSMRFFSWSVQELKVPAFRLLRYMGEAGGIQFDNFFVAYFFIILRGALIIEVGTSVTSFEGWCLAVSFLLLSWAPAVLLDVRLGLIRRRLIWIAPQAVSLAIFVRWMPSIFGNWAKKAGLKGVLSGLGIAAFLALAIGGVSIGMAFIISRYKFMPYALFAAYVVVFVGIGAWLVRIGVHRSLDRSKLRRWSTRPPAYVTGDDIIGQLRALRTWQGVHRFMNLIRARRVLNERSVDAMPVLQDLLACVEYRSALEHGSEITSAMPTGAGTESGPSLQWPRFRHSGFAAWVSENEQGVKRLLAPYNNELSDEIGRTIEYGRSVLLAV